MCNYYNLNLASVDVYTKSGQILSVCSQDFERKGNSNIIKGSNSITNLQKRACNNPNLDLANINVYKKFGQILSIHS